MHRITKILISLYNLFSIFCSHSFPFVVFCWPYSSYSTSILNPFSALSISYCCCFCSAFGCFVLVFVFACGQARNVPCGGWGKGSCGRCVVVVALVVVVIVILLLFIVTQTNITLLQPHRDMASTHRVCPVGVGSKRISHTGRRYQATTLSTLSPRYPPPWWPHVFVDAFWVGVAETSGVVAKVD